MSLWAVIRTIAVESTWVMNWYLDNESICFNSKNHTENYRQNQIDYMSFSVRL